MILLDLNGAPAKLVGNVKRYLIEIRPGVFVGKLSARTAEQLWEQVVGLSPKAAIMVYPARNEVGVAFKTHGRSRFQIFDCDGLPLIMRMSKCSSILAGNTEC
jgi:CRISPR-associated protein Cas2